MSDVNLPLPADFALPRKKFLPRDGNNDTFISGPSHESFTSRFGNAFPNPTFLNSEYGITAVYDLPAKSAKSERPVLLIHGLNTPALGMYPLALELQALDPNAHVVLFDLWGHGLSSTPLVPHTPGIFHLQILQVLSYMQWTSGHLIGFSFGGATLTSFAAQHPRAVISAALVAPAGIMRLKDLDQRMQELLDDSTGHEEEVISTVLSWLEGGPLIVPSDSSDRMASGQIVAEALRDWELREHAGYRHSVLSMFRDGGVFGGDEVFRAFAKAFQKRNVVVLGEEDDVCSKEQLGELNFEDVVVVKGAGHGVVRSHAGVVARELYRLWQGKSG